MKPKDARDLLDLKLPPMRNVHFPKIRLQLIKLMREDQADVIKLASRYNMKHWQFIEKKFSNRAQKIKKIIKQIKEPTAENIGIDGSRALWIVAQHSPPEIMKFILKSFLSSYKRDSNSVFFYAIPFLTDRVRISQGLKQIYGTQSYDNKLGVNCLFPVWNISKMNNRRAKFGLGPLNVRNSGPWPKKEDYLK